MSKHVSAKGSAGALTGFFRRDPVIVARDLLGAFLAVGDTGGVITETEAYRHDDPASHSYGGETPRNHALFGSPATAYVYRSYGVHWCLNFVCGEAQSGSAVLIRALEPTLGLEHMRERRGVDDARLLCSGPGRLTQALAVTGALDGRPLTKPPFKLAPASLPLTDIVTGPRIGITRGADTPWRFGLRASRFLSRRFL
jgi:DNA-3-methyladenine glycosylase